MHKNLIDMKHSHAAMNKAKAFRPQRISSVAKPFVLTKIFVVETSYPYKVVHCC